MMNFATIYHRTWSLLASEGRKSFFSFVHFFGAEGPHLKQAVVRVAECWQSVCMSSWFGILRRLAG
jgi:hypothetical protein